MVLKTAKTGEEFRHDAKRYVINMLSDARTLHIKGGCYYARHFSKYYDFDTLEEAENSGVEHRKCRNCFKGQYDGVAK